MGEGAIHPPPFVKGDIRRIYKQGVSATPVVILSVAKDLVVG
jgi:hypothetical protein